MTLLKRAIDQAGSLVSRRSLGLLFLAVIGTLIPTMAFGAEGENVKLAFSSGDKTLLYISLALGIVAVLFGFYLRSAVLKHSPGNEKMQEVGKAIREGALAYLAQQVRMMLIFVVVLAIGLFFLYNQQYGAQMGVAIMVCFVAGVGASYIAGYTGMLTAVDGNMRTANASLTSYKLSLEIALRSGAVAGMVTVGMGLIGATLILLIGGGNSMLLLIGFGFGGSLAALFMRVGGGIFTKAADVGADLVGKVEAGIPEDDPRNPATIADNVGDNVGDCAGMAADIFESYEVTLVAAIVLGAATAAIFDQTTWMRLILFALMARGVGIVASMIGIMTVRGNDNIDVDPLLCIRKGFYNSAGIAIVFTFAVAYLMMGGSGKTTINATVLRSRYSVMRNTVNTLMSVRDEIAARKKEKNYEVTPDDLLTDSRVKDLGFTNPADRFLSQVIGIPTVDSPDAEQLTGEKDAEPLANYSPVTDFSDTKQNPALQYAMAPQLPADQAAQQTGQAPPKYTIASLFGERGADQLQVFKLRLQQTVPGTPARPEQPPGPNTPAIPATPATPERHVDLQFWVGPFRQKDLDSILKDFQTRSAQATGTAKPTMEIMKDSSGQPMKAPVTLLENPEGKFVIGLPAMVGGRLDQISPAFRFLRLTQEDITNLMADQALGKKVTEPPSEPMDVAIVEQPTVPWYFFAIAITFGVLMAFMIEMLTDYYVSTHKKPVKEVAGVSSAGPAPMIIQGFAYACESSVFMVFSIVVALIVPLLLFSPTIFGSYILSFYGIALVGLGLLTTTGFVLAMDTFGPISDNAQGVYEMSGAGHDNAYGMKAVQRLDAAGNTTKALTKGFAITTAVVAAVALFHSYLESAHLNTIGLRLDVPEIFLGMLIGAAAPFLFASSTINAVGRASFQLINEVRRQFREDPGIMAGTSKPDYARCVAIVTAAAQRELLGPGILAIALPVAVAFGFSIGKAPVNLGGHLFNLTGAEALGGFLAGAIASGQLMAVLLANSGGMWDNAKKLIEDGLYGGKGSEAHKAGVVCDTVGDPFKDTAGPAMNPLIKVMNLVALLLAGAVVAPLADSTLCLITIVAIGALTVSIVISKRSSMSTEMAKVQEEGSVSETQAAQLAAAPEKLPAPTAKTKKKITVEEPEAEAPKDNP